MTEKFDNELIQEEIRELRMAEQDLFRQMDEYFDAKETAKTQAIYFEEKYNAARDEYNKVHKYRLYLQDQNKN